ncbi:MAG: DUF1127 domain-containing protein [Paracoccaceae bacterium]
MTTDCNHIAAPKHKVLWHELSLVRRMFFALRERGRRYQLRRAAMAMKNLNDHLLNDIGLTREDVRRISDNGSDTILVKDISMARDAQSEELNHPIDRS